MKLLCFFLFFMSQVDIRNSLYYLLITLFYFRIQKRVNFCILIQSLTLFYIYSNEILNILSSGDKLVPFPSVPS